MKIAIFGGSFNPIHIGHLALVDAACNELGYDKIALVPTFISPFKLNSNLPEPKHRLAMIDIAIKNSKNLFCEDYEIEEEGISYTIDTVSYICEKYKSTLEGKLGLIIGNDLASNFLNWKSSDKILNATNIIIGNRPFTAYQNQANRMTKSLSFPHIKLNNISLPISSSLIRNSIVEKKSWKYLVPQAVYEYIITHGLYERN